MKQFQYYLTTIQELGYVEEANHSIIFVSGLPKATLQEIVLFETGETGFVLSLMGDHVEILLFSKYSVKVGTRVVRTGTKQQMPVGFELLGRAVDPFGYSLDRSKPYKRPKLSRPIDSPPGGIATRARIDESFETGVTIVDLLVPLGKGQRELVIGDRKTGKTSFLYQSILNQARNGTICIFAAIGKKKTDIKKIAEFFNKTGIEKNTVIIASGSEDPAGVVYLTPYCAMALAEYFRDEGRDVLVILDDLFTHAKFYREISLIGRQFPGRSSYPADIFFTHARLIERAGKFIMADGAAHSITCLPVVESVQGDIAGFIQTNLMSMTDGHLYFDVDLFTKGRRSAVNPFLSVSRVGRQTQTPLRLSISREIISFMTLYQRLENFSHFGSEANAGVKHTLAMGNYIQTFFKQGPNEVINLDLQLFLFGMVWQGFWHDSYTLLADLKKIREAYPTNNQARAIITNMINSCKTINDMLAVVRNKSAEFIQILGVQLVGKPENMSTNLPNQPVPKPQTSPTTPATDSQLQTEQNQINGQTNPAQPG